MLLKHQVPVRTFADWNETQPGFFEVDVVAHCGTNAEGMFLWSLVLTDVATGWTECLALRHRSQDAVIDALDVIRQLLPFPLLGFDSDNGGEFLNYGVLAYCKREGITFTRGRAYKKNDQCFVEQKNGSIVRQLVGYDRYEGEVAYRQLAELYRAARLYVNFFQPSMKLVTKQREGSKVQRKYDAAQTPFQRLVSSGILAEERVQHLTRVFHALDPVRLLQQIQALQDALWRHVVPESPLTTAHSNLPATAHHVRFDVSACLPTGEALVGDSDKRLPATTAETTTKVQSGSITGRRSRWGHAPGARASIPSPRSQPNCTSGSSLLQTVRPNPCCKTYKSVILTAIQITCCGRSNAGCRFGEVKWSLSSTTSSSAKMPSSTIHFLPPSVRFR